jgi:hypothetical protein
VPQTDYQISYEDAKTVAKGHYHKQWKIIHPKFTAEDGYFQLSRSEQVMILRLRNGHNKMRYHLHTKLKIGTTSLCHCGLADMIAEHVLQEYPQLTDLRTDTRQTQVELEEKLYVGVESLKRTAKFIKQSGISL